MLNVDMSFAYFDSGVNHASYLFAFPDKPLKITEFTSDYLAFYGFGSGMFVTDFNHAYPIWIKDMEFINYPDLAVLLQDFKDRGGNEMVVNSKVISTYVDATRRMLLPYYEAGYYPERVQIKRIMRSVVRAIGATLSEQAIENLVVNCLNINGMIPSQANGYQPIDTCSVMGVNRYHDVYFQLGMPDLRILRGETHTVDNVEHDTLHNWKYCSQSGSATHVFKTLNSMNSRQFSANHGPEYLKALEAKISTIFPYVY